MATTTGRSPKSSVFTDQRGVTSPRLRETAGKLLTYALLLWSAVFFLGPFYWMFVSSIRPLKETTDVPVRLLPQEVTFGNFVELVQTTMFLRNVFNSIVIAISTALLAAFLSSLAGYAFSKLRFRGRDQLFLFVLGTLMIPPAAILVPNFITMAKLGLINTWWSVILPSAAPAMGIFWMRQYIGASVPDELLDAARVDGAGEFRIYSRIVLPVITPGLASLAIFVLTLSWNSFLAPLVYLKSPDVVTFTVALSAMRPPHHWVTPYHIMTAAGVVSILPMLVLFLALQRKFIAGATLGYRR